MKQQRYLIDWSHKGGYPILVFFDGENDDQPYEYVYRVHRIPN